MSEKKLKIVYKKVGELIPYENNPRINDGAVDYVANSIKEFGFKVPIVIDSDGVVVAGHTRLKACKKLGIDEVPCIVADDLTPEQVKAFRIADNKTAEKASWDDDLLSDELKDLIDDFDMTDFGFGDFELNVLTEDMTPEPFDKEVEKEYEPLEEKFLKNERVIITYTADQKEALEKLLGFEIDKVIYSAEEILK